MDRPLAVPRNRLRARIKRHIITGAALFLLVLGIGLLPVGFIYLWSDPGDFAIRPSGASEASSIQWKQTPLVAFVGVNVIPMDSEQVLTAQTVIVSNGRITDIGPEAKIKVPRSALSVDGRGKYLMPGLADMHVHLSADLQDNLALLRLFIANGVTTVLNLRGTTDHLQLRESVANGESFGPRIYTVGPFVNEPFVKTPEEVELAVREQKRAGYDFIKMHGNLSSEAYARLFAVARSLGMRVVGHAPRNLGIEAMIKERQHAVAHAEEYLYDTDGSSRNFAALEPKIASIAQATAGAGTWLIANLTAYKNIGLQVNDVNAVYSRPEMRYMPPNIKSFWAPANNPYVKRFGRETYEGFGARYKVLEKLVKGFHGAGVRLLAGTDALNPSVVPGFSIHDELQDLVAAGLSPYEAIKAATVNAAEFLESSADVGTVAVGKRADLILVEADPLKDVKNTTRLAGVMTRGQWLTAAELRKMLDAQAAAYARSGSSM